MRWPDRLLLMTHNAGKLRELRVLLGDFVPLLESAGDRALPEPVEDGFTFIENATIKARAGAEATGMPALADDSGVVIPALDGAPGIFTARWAERPDGTRDWSKARRSVHEALKGKDHRAAFVCALVIAWPGGSSMSSSTVSAEGVAPGTLVWPPRGARAYGFMPCFAPDDGGGKTYAEMAEAEQAKIDHRARAFSRLREVLRAR